MKTLKLIPVLLFTAIVSLSCSSDDDATKQEPLVESSFMDNAEGWKIVGDAQGGYIEPTYSPDGGVIGGYIYADDDVAGGVWYFAAPEAYRGNKLTYYGKTLSFNLFQDSNMSNQFEYDDVIFRSGEKQITYQHGITNYPGPNWTPYVIPIKAGSGWLLGTYESSTPASEEDIREVLSDVTEFWIRGEFESGPDSGGLDKVFIQ